MEAGTAVFSRSSHCAVSKSLALTVRAVCLLITIETAYGWLVANEKQFDETDTFHLLGSLFELEIQPTKIVDDIISFSVRVRKSAVTTQRPPSTIWTNEIVPSVSQVRSCHKICVKVSVSRSNYMSTCIMGTSALTHQLGKVVENSEE